MASRQNHLGMQPVFHTKATCAFSSSWLQLLRLSWILNPLGVKELIFFINSHLISVCTNDRQRGANEGWSKMSYSMSVWAASILHHFSAAVAWDLPLKPTPLGTPYLCINSAPFILLLLACISSFPWVGGAVFALFICLSSLLYYCFGINTDLKGYTQMGVIKKRIRWIPL